jgi:hypothetical protein
MNPMRYANLVSAIWFSGFCGWQIAQQHYGWAIGDVVLVVGNVVLMEFSVRLERRTS